MKKKGNNHWRPDCLRLARHSSGDVSIVFPATDAAAAAVCSASPMDQSVASAVQNSINNNNDVKTTSGAAAAAANCWTNRHSLSAAMMNSLREEGKGIAVIKLPVTDEPNIGIVFSGGSDKESPACISGLAPGSIALRSDALEPGDIVLSVNGVSTAGLKYSDIIGLFHQLPQRSIVQLQIQYELPVTLQNLTPSIAKCCRVVLQQNDVGSFGFTLRGGVCPEFSICRPLMVTQIRPGSAADRDGRLKVGDRVLEINGADVTKVSLSDAFDILNKSTTTITLLVEYNVSVIDAVENAAGPLLVEIDRPFCTCLGIELVSTMCHGHNVITISTVSPASIADRCGALHVGDELLSINDVGLEATSVAEAMRQLQCETGDRLVLEILPRNRGKMNRLTSAVSLLTETNSSVTSMSSIDRYASVDCLSNQSGSMATQVGSAVAEHQHVAMGTRHRSTPHSQVSQPMINVSSVVSLIDSMVHYHEDHTCHIDVTDVTLITDDANNRHFGIGIDSTDFSSEGFIRPPFISYLEPGGVAERSGLLQEGDRVLAINGWSLRGRTMHDVADMINMSHGRLTLRIEFDVADSIVSSSGMYLVKMAKRGTGVGISISCPKNRMPGQPLVISDVKKGSIAHRTGTISPGDYLLAVGDVWLENHSLELAAQILMSAEKIVKLRIQKNECYNDKVNFIFEDEPDPKSLITYNVELPRFAGRLGIALSSKSEPQGTVIIASLSPDGLAEKTGALRIGDQVLAINGVALRGKTVEDAVRLLPTTDDAINIKILRNLSNPGSRKDSNTSAASRSSRIISLDSVLESWDGWGHDYSGPRTHTPLHDWKSGRKKNSSESQTGSFTEVFCDLDQYAAASGDGRFRRSSSCTASKSSPSPFGSATNRPRKSRHDAAAAAAIADEFRSPDTGEAPSSIDTSGMMRLETVTPRCDATPPGGIAASTAIIDERDVAAPITASNPCDWSPATNGNQQLAQSSSATGHRASIVTPLEELILTSLQRSTELESFGFSLSNGVSESGIYVGAVKHSGPAAEKLQPYDRILKVNGVKVEELSCADVVPLIAQSGRQLDLVVSRRSLNSITDDPGLTTGHRSSSPGYLFPTASDPSNCGNNVIPSGLIEMKASGSPQNCPPPLPICIITEDESPGCYDNNNVISDNIKRQSSEPVTPVTTNMKEDAV